MEVLEIPGTPQRILQVGFKLISSNYTMHALSKPSLLPSRRSRKHVMSLQCVNLKCMLMHQEQDN